MSTTSTITAFLLNLYKRGYHQQSPLIITFFIFASLNISISQAVVTKCGWDLQAYVAPPIPSQTPVACINSLGTDVDYIPASTQPIKYIDVVINVMQKESPSSPENFIDIAAHRDFLLDIVNNACNLNVLSSNDEPIYNGAIHPELNHVPDTKIRLNVKEINFIQDNRGWNNDGDLYGDYNYENNARHSDVALNIFIIEGTVVLSNQGEIILWGLGGIGNSQYLMLNGMFKEYQNSNGNVPQWESLWLMMGDLLAHEVGHTLGLSHSWGSCVEIDDIDPCPHEDDWCNPWAVLTLPCVNNVMSYANFKRWLSPKQIGRIHRNLTNRDISRFVRHEKVSGQDIEIASDAVWSINRWVFGDIVVKTGSTLKINSKIYMPLNSKLIVERGARLFLDCGTLTTARTPINTLQVLPNGDYWDGIQVWGNTALPHITSMSDPFSPLATYPDHAGRMISKNSSKIFNSRTAISTRNSLATWPSSETFFGGFVHATNTEFKNNRRGLEFMKYDFKNFGLVEECDFIANNENSYHGITMWSIQQFNINNCNFIGLKSQGVLGHDATFNIKNCDFLNTHHGAESYSSLPLHGSIGSVLNTFDACDVGLRATNALSCISIADNYFTNYTGSNLIGDSRYLLLNGNYVDCYMGTNIASTKFNGDNQLRCNSFLDNETSSLYLGDNEGSKFVFNNFENTNLSGKDVELSYFISSPNEVQTGIIRFDQAWINPFSPATFLPAGNLFSPNYSFIKKHILTEPNPTNPNFSDEFIYHHSGQPPYGREYPYCGLNGVCPVGQPYYKFTYEQHLGLFSNICTRTVAGHCVTIDCYDELLLDYNSKKENYNQSPSTLTKQLYQAARSIKYYSLDTIIRDHLNRRDYVALDQFLQIDSEPYIKRARIGLKVLQSDYYGARQLLAAYPIAEPGDQDFVDIQNINLNRLENRSGISNADRLTLQSIIDKKSIERGYAMAIFSHELDSIYEPELGESSIQPRSFESAHLDRAKESHVQIYPNPTNGMVKINLLTSTDIDAIKSIEVTTIDGISIIHQSFQGNSLELDLSNYPNGIYVVKILNLATHKVEFAKLFLGN